MYSLDITDYYCNEWKSFLSGILNTSCCRQFDGLIEKCSNSQPPFPMFIKICRSKFLYYLNWRPQYLKKNTIWPEKLNPVWKHPQILQIQCCSNHYFQGWAIMGGGGKFYILGINREKSSTHLTIWQEKLFKTLHKRASLGSVRVDSSFFKSWSPA